MSKPLNKSLRLGFILILLLLLMLAGCASTEYGCKGMPEDPRCLSTLDAYQLSEKALPEPDRTDFGPVGSDVANTANGGLDGHSAVSAIGNPLIQQQPMPKIDDPTPIRTPAQVMRIWIAPWEDAEGDLMVSSYVYTELEPRRWMIGKAAPTISPSLVPLQVEQRPPERHFDKDDAETDLRGPTAKATGPAGSPN